MEKAIKVSFISILVNLLLSIFKLIAGVIGKSGAMISDAIHSASDVISSLIVIIGIKFAHKEADKEHRYGHERMESIASIVLSAILAVVGVQIGINGFKTIFSGNYDNLQTPTMIALIASIVSIITKEAMFWYTRFVAKQINSGALMADAWHHRSDALSSIGSFIGILGAILGMPVLDAVASVAICILIIKATIEIFLDAVSKLVDKSCDNDTIEKMRQSALDIDGVENIDDIRTRLFGNKIYVDIEICADGTISLNEAHSIAENVHNKMETDFCNVKHCMVHVNPINKKD